MCLLVRECPTGEGKNVEQSDAGVQKNIGPAGLAIAIVREDLLGNARPDCPTMCDYTIMAESDSMYNTPPCWAVYVCGLVFKKLLAEGGLDAVQQRNITKVHLHDA
jgi:phosphoserine aminotransferase